MNIAIFSTYILQPSHYETELEIILNHEQKGDNIVRLVCNKELPACDNNPYYQPEACERCVSKRKAGNSVLSTNPETRSFLNLTDSDKKRIAEIPTEFNSIAELQKLWIDNYDIGFSIASSLISITRNPNPHLDPQLLERYIVSCAGTYFSIINYLKENPTDLFYTFNGRLSHTKAVLRACNKMGITCLLHERGNTFTHYSLFENTSIHNLSNTTVLIKSTWEEADPFEREELARKWFETRIGGKMQNWYSFLEDQKLELPANWDSNKENIVICNSSEDEYASLGDEWKNPVYDNQLQGIKQILAEGAELKETYFYLRIHPNLANVKTPELEELRSLLQQNLTIIPADSKLSTYLLVKHASKVITFGSTIGIEATYLKTPSICLGKSFYYYLDGAYTPKSHKELMQLLGKKHLEPKNVEGAMKFAYYFGTFGIPFEHYRAETFAKGTIGGKEIKPKLGLKYKLIKWLFESSLLKGVIQKLFYKRRESVLKKYLP